MINKLRLEIKWIIEQHRDTHLRYGESTIETEMRFKDILSDIENKFKEYSFKETEEKN